MVPILVDSSPARMDIDSPRHPSSSTSNRPFGHPRSLSDSHASPPTKFSLASATLLINSSGGGAPDDLADLFDDDLSPIRVNSRKRFLASDIENSPTPILNSNTTGSPSPFTTGAGNRRSYEKSVTLSSLGMMSMVGRRRSGTSAGGGSSSGLTSAQPRPSLSNFRSMDPPPPSLLVVAAQTIKSSIAQEDISMGSHYKRQGNGKSMPKLMRRAYSVADAAFAPLSARDVNIMANQSQAMMMREEKKDIKSPLTGFRTQEEKGKALPCFGVKEDGLMRITSDTVSFLFLSLQSCAHD
jgi:hypothetical protein